MTTEYETRCPDIECQGCASSINRSLGKVAGVESVDVDVAKKLVTIAYDDALTNEIALGERLTAAGFPPDAERAA